MVRCKHGMIFVYVSMAEDALNTCEAFMPMWHWHLTVVSHCVLTTGLMALIHSQGRHLIKWIVSHFLSLEEGMAPPQNMGAKILDGFRVCEYTGEGT